MKQNTDEHKNDTRSVKIQTEEGIPSPKRDEDVEEERTNPYSMTSEDLRKRMLKPQTGRLSTQIYTCFAVSTGALSFGTVLGWSSPMLLDVLYQYKETTDHSDSFTWISSMVPLGCSFGFGIWSLVATKKGPRKTLLYQMPINVLIWVLLATSNNHIHITTYRFFLGFFGISYIVCGQTLLHDAVHRSLYKFTLVAFQTTILIGVAFTQVVGLYLGLKTTTCCAVIPLINAISLLVLPESPVFLFRKGEKAAEIALSWYQGKNNIAHSMRFIRKCYEYRRINIEEYKYILYATVVVKAILIVFGIIVIQVLSGYYLFLFYGTLFWSDVSVVSRSVDSVVICFILCFSRLFWMLMHIKLKLAVRMPLVISCIVVGTSLGFLTIIMLFDSIESLQDDPDELMTFKWLCLLFCATSVFGFELGLNYYPRILLHEYMPFQVYRFASTFINSVFWFLVFVTVKCYGLWYAVHPYSTWMPLAFASFSMYVGAIYVYFVVVEVKGKSLIQIQVEIGGNPIGNRTSLNLRSEGILAVDAISTNNQLEET